MKIKTNRNIKILYIYNALRGGAFTIPIWTVFESRFLTFPEQAFFAAMVKIAVVLLELPTGVVADLLGKKKTLILGSFFTSIGFILLGAYPSREMMWLFALLTGLGMAFISGADSALTYDTLADEGREDEYPRINARMSSAFQITAIFALATGGYLYEMNIAFPYFARGLLFLFAIPIIFLIKESTIDTEKFNFSNYIKQIVIGSKEVFKNKYITKISMLYFLIGGLSASAQRFFIQPYMREIGIDTIQRGWLASINKFLLVIVLLLITKNKKIFNSIYFILVVPIVMSLVFSVIGLFNVPWILIGLVGINLPSASRSVFLGLPLNKKIRSKYRATAISFLNLLMQVVYASSNYFGGLFSDKYSIGTYFYVIAAISTIIFLPLAISVVRDEKMSIYNNKAQLL